MRYYSTHDFIEAYTEGGTIHLSNNETSMMMNNYSEYKESGDVPQKLITYFQKKNPRETIVIPEEVPHNFWEIAKYLNKQISHREQGRIYKAFHNDLEFAFYVCDNGDWGVTAEDICLDYEEETGKILGIDFELQKELLHDEL